jgi:AraC-like DNA-binding protein
MTSIKSKESWEFRAVPAFSGNTRATTGRSRQRPRGWYRLDMSSLKDLTDPKLSFDLLPCVTAINIARVPEDRVFEVHRLDYHEMNFISHGCYTVSLGGSSYRTEPGWVYGYQPDDVISARSHPGDGELVCHWIKFSWPRSTGDGMALPRMCQLDAKEQSRWTTIFDQVQEHQAASEHGGRLAATAGLLQLLSILLGADARRRHGGAMPDRRMSAALAFLERNQTRPLLMADVAKVTGMSEDAFSRVFRQQLGRPPLQHLIRLRLSSARRLLVHEPNLPITDVAQRCGFDDPGHFTRLFRKHFGTPPGAFRTRLTPI